MSCPLQWNFASSHRSTRIYQVGSQLFSFYGRPNREASGFKASEGRSGSAFKTDSDIYQQCHTFLAPNVPHSISRGAREVELWISIGMDRVHGWSNTTLTSVSERCCLAYIMAPRQRWLEGVWRGMYHDFLGYNTDLLTSRQVTRLQHTLEEKYRFKTSKVELTCGHGPRPQVQLNKEVANFVSGEDKEHTLLIVYYAGHGHPGSNPGHLHLTGWLTLVQSITIRNSNSQQGAEYIRIAP